MSSVLLFLLRGGLLDVRGSISKSLDQLPPMMDYNIRHGKTYMYFKGEPLYPFGFGLSYTTFDVGQPSAPQISDGTVTLTVPVKNTGTHAGAEG